ncbi:MAG: hypothetical protein M1281_13015 [Chloroflexi bacterium]|nr:hypothetical protein [Chloroflexota bacterium]
MIKRIFLYAMLILTLAAGVLAAPAPAFAGAMLAEDTPAPSSSTTPPPSQSSGRPMVLFQTYSASVDPVQPGQDFNLNMILVNSGNSNAYNIVVSFTPGDIIPRNTGGTLLVQQLIPGETRGINQPVVASTTLEAGSIANLPVNISYIDQFSHETFTASFNLAFHVAKPHYGPVLPTATPTQVVVMRPQLAITDYTVETEPLQPGVPFTLKLDVRNLGNADAKSVTVIMGGGSASQGGSSTPQPGGIAGASGEFTNFAPLHSSNIQFIGDIPAGQIANSQQSLIVNTTTNPGAYPVKFSFDYTDSKGAHYTDDQVITLLVFSLPLVEMNFYRDPGPFFVGQPGALPIQIVNLSRKATVLGNLKATVQEGEVMNNVTLVGAMDPGGYFTLDAMLVPARSGPLDVDVTVSYTDDFNQLKTISQKLTIEVQEAVIEPVPSGNPGDMPVEPVTAPETLWDKVVRFFKGLVGLDSGKPELPTPAATTPMPGEAVPVPGGKIIPVPAKGG